MDDVGALAAGGHLQVDAEGSQRRVGPLQLGDLRVAGHAVVGPLGTGLAAPAEGVDAHIGQGPQHPRELVDVDASASIDERRVLLGEQIDSQ